MFYLTVMLGFLFFASVAMTVNEGLWNNTITLFCIILAGLLGVLEGVPLGNFLLERSGKPPEAAWYFIFAGIWGVFALSVFVIRQATDFASGVRMRFLPLVDKIMGPMMGLLVALILTSFTAFTLERVPIQAGEWSLRDAASWQISTLKYARAPFYNVIKNFARNEKPGTWAFLGMASYQRHEQGVQKQNQGPRTE